jgi:hypothetical protein
MFVPIVDIFLTVFSIVSLLTEEANAFYPGMKHELPGGSSPDSTSLILKAAI